MDLTPMYEPSWLDYVIFFGVLLSLPIGAWVLRHQIAEAHGIARWSGRALQVSGALFAVVAVPVTAMVLLMAMFDLAEIVGWMLRLVFE